jgi:DNA-binding response OmpR family regulator
MITVLVVDDDPAIGRILKLILQTAGMEVVKVENGPSALAWLHDGHDEPDVILLDLMMPGMDGREVFREVRRSGITAPVLFCSAYGAETANRELGAQGAIAKPFHPEALIASVERITESSHS